MSTTSKLAAVLAVAVATTLTAASADARPAHRRAHVQQETTVPAPQLQGLFDRSYNLYAPTSEFRGFTPEPNGPSNWNRDQG